MVKPKTNAARKISVVTIAASQKSQLPTTFFEDKAVLHARMYEQIFGKTFRSQQNLPWKRGIVRIEYRKADQKAIVQRMYISHSPFRLKINQIGLTRLSQHILQCSPPGQTQPQVTISKGSRLRFYWKHPDHVTRVGIKIGIFSIGIAILALLLTIPAVLDLVQKWTQRI